MVTTFLACSTDDASPALAAATNDAGGDSTATGTGTGSADGGDAAPAIDAATFDASTIDASSAPVVCSGLTPYCAAYFSYANECGYQKLACDGGCSFVQKCNPLDTALNSAAYRDAEIACLTAANCDTVKRRDCGYQKLAASTPTAAQ